MLLFRYIHIHSFQTLDMRSVISRVPLILLALLLCIAVVSPASAVPPLPYELYGEITIDGIPAPAGTEILAKINDQIVGGIDVEFEGIYGDSGTFDKRLVINADEADLGQTATFWVGDRQAAQKVTMQAGMSQNLDLTFIEGQEGTIDASLPVPAPQTGESTQAPLMVAPFLGLLAAVVLMKKKSE